MRDIGANIQQARQMKNMTQEALAQAIHTTRQTVSNYETGRSRPDADTLILLAEALAVPAEVLLYGPDWNRGISRRQTALFVIALTLFIVSLWYGIRAEYFLWYRETVEGKAPSNLLWALYSITPALWLLLPGWLLPQALQLLGKARPLGGPLWLHTLLLIAATALLVCLALPCFFPDHLFGRTPEMTEILLYKCCNVARRFCYYFLPPLVLGFGIWLTGKQDEENPHA